MLNVMRWERLVSSLGKLPFNWLKDKSIDSRLVRFANAAGIAPVKLFRDRTLHNRNQFTNRVENNTLDFSDKCYSLEVKTLK